MPGRYALALFELAKEKNSVGQVAADLATFARLMTESADLQRLVLSPVFSAEEQTRALDVILRRAGVGGLASNFIRLIATKRRLFAVRAMIDAFNKLNDADRNVVRADVTVAEPLSEERLADLKAALNQATGGQDVAVQIHVDPAIIGGLVVRLGSRMVDGSIRTKLNSLRTRMKEVG